MGMKYLKYMSLFEEKINPKSLDGEWEDNEDEEDDDILSTMAYGFVGGKIYRATIEFVLVDNNSGVVKTVAFSTIKQSINSQWGDWRYSIGNQYSIYEINPRIDELRISKYDGKIIYFSGNTKPKRNYRIMVKNFTGKDGNLSDYVIRQSDVLSFNRLKAKSGLSILYNSLTRRAKTIIKNKTTGDAKEITKLEIQLGVLKKSIEDKKERIKLFGGDINNYILDKIEKL